MIISVDCKPAVLARPFLLDGLLACTGVVEVLLALLDSLCTLGEDDLFLDLCRARLSQTLVFDVNVPRSFEMS